MRIKLILASILISSQLIACGNDKLDQYQKEISEAKLQPCPFCHSTEVEIVKEGDYMVIVCTSCKMQSPRYYIDGVAYDIESEEDFKKWLQKAKFVGAVFKKQ